MVAQQASKQTQKNHISLIDYIGLSTTPIDNVIVEDSTMVYNIIIIVYFSIELYN